MRWVSIQLSSVGTVTKPRVTMGKKLNSGTMAVTQWKRCHENVETASVRWVRCRVATEASLERVVAQIVTKLQVTRLQPWRGRPHVYIVDAQLSLCTDVDSQRCTSTNPDLHCLVVAAPLSPSKKQSSSWSSHVADLVDLHT